MRSAAVLQILLQIPWTLSATVGISLTGHQGSPGAGGHLSPMEHTCTHPTNCRTHASLVTELGSCTYWCISSVAVSIGIREVIKTATAVPVDISRESNNE